LTLVVEAAEHIESDSPAAASKLVRNAFEAAASLTTLADRGRLVPELDDSVHREIFVGRYRLIYRVDSEHVSIVAFVHGARNFRPWWRRYRRKNVPN
jgi:plasmid stabilization system protein ParE